MPDKAKDSEVGIWESILREAQAATRVPDKTLLVMGRPGIGKRTLVQALYTCATPGAVVDAGSDMAAEGNSRAVGIDYGYFGNRDPADTEAASAPEYSCPAATTVLMMEDVKFEKVLRDNMKADDLKHMYAMICLDLKEPWKMMEDFRQWVEFLLQATSDLLQQLPLGEQDELRARVADAVANYSEPSDGDQQNGDQQDAGGRPSGASITYNLGVPVVVVVTRSDGASAFETQKTLGWAETIEAHLRSEALSYGAALIYTMAQAKNARNVDVLYDYLMHRMYAYPLKRKPQVPSRDALFLPSGWDSQAKVDQVAAQLPGGKGLQTSFESVIVSTEPPAAELPKLEVCEDLQTFLKNQVKKLAEAPASQTKRSSTAGVEATRSDKDALPRKSATGRDSMSGQATDNASLAKFFENLLERGEGARASVSATAGANGAVADAAAPKAPVADADAPKAPAAEGERASVSAAPPAPADDGQRASVSAAPPAPAADGAPASAAPAPAPGGADAPAA